MISITLIMITLLITQISSTCNNQLSCFKTKLFNFNPPQQNLYQLTNIINTSNNDKTLNSYNVMAYGDFNGDLYTDFIAMNKSNRTSTSLIVFIWNKDTSLFDLFQQLDSTQCPATNVFLYDINFNGYLDIVIWGILNGQNCILPFIHNTTTFIKKQPYLNIDRTSNPFIISYGPNNNLKQIGLLIYLNGNRTILKYQNKSNAFQTKPWNTLFISLFNYQNVPFAQPHSNSYLDLTGDCRGDVAIVNQNNTVQFWVYNANLHIFQYHSVLKLENNFSSLTFTDMNSDGLVDMIIAYQTYIDIHFNSKQLTDASNFCVDSYNTITFQNPIKVLTFGTNQTFIHRVLQIKDINIDGFPDLMLPLNYSNGTNLTQYVNIYMNNNEGKKFEKDSQGHYDLTKILNNVGPIISVSFIDFLENGIMDFIICTRNATYAIYNNYLQQNYYFIKGYGETGIGKNYTQIIGASFYWINSVGDGTRMQFQPQIPQTAYNALQTPFAFCGIGRANNYVQSFTLGVYGKHYSWSPIIPNSQLAVSALTDNQDQWTIRIFVLPQESLIYVIIISAIILFILGVILVVLKYKNYKKKQQPLMEIIY